MDITRLDSEWVQGLRTRLLNLPPTKIRSKTLENEVLVPNPNLLFCMSTSLEGVVSVIEWWYAALFYTFDRMSRIEAFKDFDIFCIDPRLVLEMRLLENSFYYIKVCIDHSGKSSRFSLGEGVVARRSEDRYEIYLTKLDWTVEQVSFLFRLLSEDYEGLDVFVLQPGKYEEIRLKDGRIIIIEEDDDSD